MIEQAREEPEMLPDELTFGLALIAGLFGACVGGLAFLRIVAMTEGRFWEVLICIMIYIGFYNGIGYPALKFVGRALWLATLRALRGYCDETKSN